MQVPRALDLGSQRGMEVVVSHCLEQAIPKHHGSLDATFDRRHSLLHARGQDGFEVVLVTYVAQRRSQAYTLLDEFFRKCLGQRGAQSGPREKNQVSCASRNKPTGNAST